MAPTLTAFLEATRARVDARLAEVLGEADADTRATAPEALPILAAARDLTLRGGKRLRPALLFAAIAAVTDDVPATAVDLGAALELLQSYLLVHDDWMDGDRVRRGAPSVHAALADHYRDEHLGAATGVLAGDYLSCLVHDLVARLDAPLDRHKRVLRVFARMEREVILGQCMDIIHSTDVDRVHHLKTGSYTVRGPLALGHALAGGTPATLDALEAYAGPLGLAFQLRDDILGVLGTASQTGKPVGGDLREGKPTAVVSHALAHLDPDDQATLRSVLGCRDATDDAIARACGLVEASGARAAVESRIDILRAQCLAALDTPALRSEGRELLYGLAHILTERTR